VAPVGMAAGSVTTTKVSTPGVAASAPVLRL
jgi:hypothetical protein